MSGADPQAIAEWLLAVCANERDNAAALAAEWAGVPSAQAAARRAGHRADACARVVRLHWQLVDDDHDDPAVTSLDPTCLRLNAACDTLRLLALMFSNLPGWDPAWAPHPAAGADPRGGARRGHG